MSWLLLISLVLPQALLQQQPRANSATEVAGPSTAAADGLETGGNAAEASSVDVEDAWMQEARDWLVACRVAHDRLTPQQTRALTERFQKLSPAALRVLMTVYEQSFGMTSPLSAADRRPPNATDAEREWIMAYRILFDRLSPEEAQQYARTLEAMSPSQIRALVGMYEEKNRLRRERAEASGGTSTSPPPESENQLEAQRNLEVARQRMQFEQQQRQMALGRAGTARRQSNQALVSANSSANRAAAAENARLRDMQQFTNAQTLQHNAFQNRMYERSSTPNPYNNNFFFRLY